MPDPLSSVASIVTLVAGAAESLKVLVTFCRDLHNAPAEIHEWLTMLEALRLTLSSLEESGRNLDSRYHFSPNFHQRLLTYVEQLQDCVSEIAQIDTALNKANADSKRKWNHNAKRLWIRAKWTAIRDQKMKTVMGSMQLYHFEFGVELLKMLM